MPATASLPTASTTAAPALRLVEPDAPPPSAAALDAAELLAFAKRLTRSRRAAVDLAALPAVWRVSEEDAAAILAALAAVDLAAVWERPRARPSVILTPYAAGLLGLELVDRINSRDASSLRWVPAGTGDDPGPPAEDPAMVETDLFADPDALGLDDLADARAVDPAAAAERSEAEERWSKSAPKDRKSVRGLAPRPVLLVGLRPPWPAVAAPGEPCPACRGRRLKLLECCLVCDAMGNADLLEPVYAHELPRPKPEPRGKLAGGKGASKPRPSKGKKGGKK